MDRRTPRHPTSYKKYTKTGKTSDSEESTTSNPETNGSAGSGADISIVAEFDDLMRFMKPLIFNTREQTTSYLDLIEKMKILSNRHLMLLEDNSRLQQLLDIKTQDQSDLEVKLSKARKFIDHERNNTKKVAKERDEMFTQITLIRQILFEKDSKVRLSEDMKNKLAFLNSYQNSNNGDWESNGNGPFVRPQLSDIKEVNSTGSILSDLSYSRSEDDLDESHLMGKNWKKHRPSSGGPPEPAPKKRRSSTQKTVDISPTDTVRATTTLTVMKDGPIRATSVIESLPQPEVSPTSPTSSEEPRGPPANLVFESWARNSPKKATPQNIKCRQHSFQQKTIVMPETCGQCGKRIGFGKTALKCKGCRALCHIECKDSLPLPCIPVIGTPKNRLGVIGDYTPTTPPMVPALLVHCINEIELRGLNEIGLYRIPGAERDVKALKEKFLRGRGGAPCLNQVDIHVICGTVKDFLRSLHEPILTSKLWKDFVKAVECQDENEIVSRLCKAIGELPQPNRDTLAYMVLHLQKIAASKDCKMPIGNLAKIFGPTIVGYSSKDPDMNGLLAETRQLNQVMEGLINIPNEYWSSFIDVDNSLQPPSKLQQTPSTDSLLRPTARPFFTPNRNLLKRKQKFFPTPPMI